MSEPLEQFYERELVFLEETAAAFAQRYPANAKHLAHEPGRSVDPHLERLIEGFAVLAGRVHHKVRHGFSELTESLLQILYPHLGLIVPALAIAQVNVAANVDMRQGLRLEKDALSRSQAFGTRAERLQYSLGYNTTVWPITLERVLWETSPFDPALRPPNGTVAVLRMHFACQHGLKWDDLEIDKLRLYLSGERQLIATLYEIIFNRCLGVALQAPDLGPEAGTSRPPIRLTAEECLFQVGFELDEGLLPFPPESFLGHRLLMELLSFPQKFMFVDLAGWQQLVGRAFGDQVEVVLYLTQTQENLERGLSAENILLGCVPIVNLYPQSAEPLDWHHRQSDYRVIASRRPLRGTEVYRVESVRSIDSETGNLKDFHPFYASEFAVTQQSLAYYHTVRRESLIEGDAGTEVYIALVDPEFHPGQPANRVLDIQVTCSNRDLPFKFQQAGDRLVFSSDPGGERCSLSLLHKPTQPLRPFLVSGTYWRLLGQSCLNHVSLIDGKEGLAALKELFSLCDFSGPRTPQLAAVNQQIIDGIRAVRSRPIMERVRSSVSQAGMCRGMEILMEFDEEKYTGTGVFLVASVLERFFGMYTGINSFTKVIARTIQAEGNLKAWPPRAGAHRLP